MPRDLGEVAVGERWAYRQKQTGPVTCVEVVRLGTGRPARAQVRLIDDQFEGRLEWVPPGRLQVLWADVEDWLLNEQRWSDLREVSAYIRGTPEDHALSTVFAYLPEWDLASPLHNDDSGILLIYDVDGVAADLDLERDFLAGDPSSFESDGGLLVPWRVSRAIVERLARKYVDTLLPHVEAEEQKARQENRWGYVCGSGEFISAEICAKVDQQYAPARQLVRQWCGQEAQERYDELVALRVEVVRLGKLVERAISAVRTAGNSAEADALERELGVPLEVLRRVPEPD